MRARSAAIAGLTAWTTVTADQPIRSARSRKSPFVRSAMPHQHWPSRETGRRVYCSYRVGVRVRIRRIPDAERMARNQEMVSHMRPERMLLRLRARQVRVGLYSTE